MQNVSVWKTSSGTAAFLHLFHLFSDVSSFVHISMLLSMVEQIQLNRFEKKIKVLCTILLIPKNHWTMRTECATVQSGKQALSPKAVIKESQASTAQQR